MHQITYTDIKDLPLTLSANHIAAVLGISRSQAYNLLHENNSPATRKGKRLLVPVMQFIRWMNEQTGGVA